MVKIGEKYTINGINQYLEYDFMKINEEKIYGKLDIINIKKNYQFQMKVNYF